VDRVKLLFEDLAKYLTPERVKKFKSIENTMKYINIEEAIFKESDDKFHVKVAGSLEEACQLLEIGYEFVTDMNGKKLFRKRE
jgi:hypothetical protein